MTLFDTIPEPAKRQAIAQAWQGATDEWKREALAALESACRRLPEFTTDAIAELRDCDEPRAIGPVMLIGKRNGWCVPLDRTVKSKSAKNHHRDLRVWRSLIVE